MADESPPLRERMLALEQIRSIETRIIQRSVPLIRRLLHDATNFEWDSKALEITSEVLRRGELWWSPLDEDFPCPDPRCFPVVGQWLATSNSTGGSDHFLQSTRVEGQTYLDLVSPLRDLVSERTRLARVAGITRD
ncbi:MAG: hypothetical protein GWP38_03270 [Planctomycetia bacterium]|jgi:hypothetical protein|nr:hypothetical protein [Planctomycetia bacterium]